MSDGLQNKLRWLIPVMAFAAIFYWQMQQRKPVKLISAPENKLLEAVKNDCVSVADCRLQEANPCHITPCDCRDTPVSLNAMAKCSGGLPTILPPVPALNCKPCSNLVLACVEGHCAIAQ